MNYQEIILDGVTYIPKNESVKNEEGLEYCIIRADRAGVFAGYLESKTDQEVVLQEARRLWYWAGAASLSQLAMEGTSKPDDCKFPVALKRVTISGWIEIIPVTEKAKKSIEAVKVWTA